MRWKERRKTAAVLLISNISKAKQNQKQLHLKDRDVFFYNFHIHISYSLEIKIVVNCILKKYGKGQSLASGMLWFFLILCINILAIGNQMICPEMDETTDVSICRQLNIHIRYEGGRCREVN